PAEDRQRRRARTDGRRPSQTRSDTRRSWPQPSSWTGDGGSRVRPRSVAGSCQPAAGSNRPLSFESIPPSGLLPAACYAMNLSIAPLPGDGVGPEVVAAAGDVLDAIAKRFHHTVESTTNLMGGAALRAGKPALPPDTLANCRAAKATLMGAVGDPAF